MKDLVIKKETKMFLSFLDFMDSVAGLRVFFCQSLIYLRVYSLYTPINECFCWSGESPDVHTLNLHPHSEVKKDQDILQQTICFKHIWIYGYFLIYT